MHTSTWLDLKCFLPHPFSNSDTDPVTLTYKQPTYKLWTEYSNQPSAPIKLYWKVSQPLLNFLLAKHRSRGWVGPFSRSSRLCTSVVRSITTGQWSSLCCDGGCNSLTRLCSLSGVLMWSIPKHHSSPKHCVSVLRGGCPTAPPFGHATALPEFNCRQGSKFIRSGLLSQQTPYFKVVAEFYVSNCEVFAHILYTIVHIEAFRRVRKKIKVP